MSRTITNPFSDEVAQSRPVVDVLLLVSLLCIAVLHRVSTIAPLIYWPDTIGYWTQAREIAEGLPYSTDFHRSSRLGVVLPVAMFQNFAGTTVTQFYLFAALQSIAQVALVFLMARLFVGPWSAALTGTLFLAWSLEDFDGTYITADGVAGAWIALSFYLMMLYSFRGKGGLFAYLSVLAMACAYLSKITSVFFLPGLFLVWHHRDFDWYRRRSSWLFVGGAVASFIGVERAVLAWVTGSSHSVMSLTVRSYGKSGKLKPLSLADYLLRPLDLPGEQLSWLVCTIALCLLFVSRKALRARRETTLLVAASIFILALLYTPKALFPLTPAALVRARYYSATLPIMSVALVVGAHALLSYFSSSASRGHWERLISTGVLSSLGVISLARFPHGIQTFTNVLANSAMVTEAYHRGCKIFARPDRPGKYLLNATRWLLIPGPGEPPLLVDEGDLYALKRPNSVGYDNNECVRIRGSLKESTRRNKNRELVKVAVLPSSADTFLSVERVAPDRCP